MKPSDVSKNSREKVVHNNLQDRRQQQRLKFKLGDLFRTADF